MDLDLWHLPDTIEENVINERCSVEVLNRLIAKADEEIFDLEDDLAILKSQLRWTEHAEHEKLYDIWCATFREKITSLNRSLQTLRKRCAPNNHALNACNETHHLPAERIHGIIRVLLEQNFPTESKQVKDGQNNNQEPERITIVAEGNTTSEDLDNIKAKEPVPSLDLEKETSSSKGCMPALEVREEATTVSASLDLSRKPENEQIIGTENQPMTAHAKRAKGLHTYAKRVKGLHIPDVKLTEIHGLTSEKRETPSISEPDCHKKVSDNDIKGESFDLQGAKTVEGSEAILLHQQECEEKGETGSLPRAPPALKRKKKERKKSEPNPARSEIGDVEERNQKLCVNGTDDSSPKRSPTSEESSNRNTRHVLEKMNRPQLIAMLKSHGIKGYSNTRKSLIVDKILLEKLN